MQVRPVEFQESFARLPVEQARQQQVLQREPDLARDQSARSNADSHLLDLSRPVQTTEVEGNIIRADQERSSKQPPRRNQRIVRAEDRVEDTQSAPLGRNIDVIV
ncbi:MAG: hypothetical protein HOE48_08065 [Candidatus Latescibacteria bacterium]|jgi:hypothetical protein|nr:hypothetical protein [Candidatus Latescibacterota bacterium]